MQLDIVIQEILQREGDAIIRDLQSAMVSTGANASRRTSASLLNEVSASGISRATMTISGGEGWKFVEQGRGATKKNQNGILLPIIKQWIKDKGIAIPNGYTLDSFAFVVTRKIHKQGTNLWISQTRRDIYSSVINEERINSITSQVTKSFIANATSDVVQALKNKL
jgi:hypothetical protein